MEPAVEAPAAWPGPDLWAAAQPLPLRVLLSGLDRSADIEAALREWNATDAITLQLKPDRAAPCDVPLWRLETASGEALNSPSLVRRHWHRPPYALTVRLVRYAPGSTAAEILDEGTVGTRMPRAAFVAALQRLAARFVLDATRGCGRGASGLRPATSVAARPGWLDHLETRWRHRLMSEWWSLGTSSTPVGEVLQAGHLDAIHWFRPKAGRSYLADPFPWFGTARVLAEEMPVSAGIGRIVALGVENGQLTEPTPIMDDGFHHSYPCTLSDQDAVFCVPESIERGATRIYQLTPDGALTPVCDVALEARLADPTLFRHGGKYWIACTDLDLGNHDNLCLLHAPAPSGPWVRHARWPVRIDVRGARCAGNIFSLGGRLFRPGQDCASTYGAGVAIHEIEVLSEADFRETLVTVLRPDPAGPFPHGLHTLNHDGERLWVDGKRFFIDFQAIGQKLLRRVSRTLARSRMN